MARNWHYVECPICEEKRIEADIDTDGKVWEWRAVCDCWLSLDTAERIGFKEAVDDSIADYIEACNG